MSPSGAAAIVASAGLQYRVGRCSAAQPSATNQLHRPPAMRAPREVAILRAMATTNGELHLGPDFLEKLTKALPRLLAAGALPDDWDHRATTYDLPRFDTDVDFAGRFEKALSEILEADMREPGELRERLAKVGLPFDYARLGQPLSTVFELYTQARTHAARCFSFASVTKPWLSVIESPKRRLPVRIYAQSALPISDGLKSSLRAEGCELHEQWSEELPARSD